MGVRRAKAHQEAERAIGRYDELVAAQDCPALARWGVEHESIRLDRLDQLTTYQLQLRLAAAHELGGRPAASLAHCRAVLPLLGPPATATDEYRSTIAAFSLLAADMAIEVGEFQVAQDRLAVIETHLSETPQAAEVEVRYLGLLWLGGRLDDAERQLAVVLGAGRPEDAAPHVTLHAGLIRRDQGDLGRARSLMRAANSHSDVPFYVPLVLADTCARMGDPSEARAVLAASDASLPAYQDFAVAYRVMIEGRVLWAEGEAERALRTATDAAEKLQSLGVRPYIAEARRLAGQIAGSTGDRDSARWWLSGALDLYRHLGCRDPETQVERDLDALP